MVDNLIIFALLLSVAIGVVIFILWGHFARRDIRRLHDLSYYSQKFFKSSQTLICDDGTPQSLIESIAYLNGIITDEARARDFFVGYVRLLREKADRSERGDNGTVDPEFSAFLKSRPELNECVFDSLLSGLLAMTFLHSDHWGEWARSILMDAYGRERRPTTVIAAIKNYKEAHLNHAMA